MPIPLLPQRADNTYRGSKAALWLFALPLLMKLAISLGCLFNGHQAAGSADGIPLDTFTPAGARTVVALFAILGLSDFSFCLVCIVGLIRYRTPIPLMFVLLVLEHLGRRLILLFLPIPRTGTPPGFAINLALLALLIVGLVLSLRSRDTSPAPGRRDNP